MLTKPASVLHCDWLQLHLKRLDKLSTHFHRHYTVKKLDFSTRHFALIEEFYVMNRRVATLTSKPLSGILDPDSYLVKFDNWVLYDKRFREIVSDFLRLNEFEFISCSRVDFCADFNEFFNGMHPETFIRKYMYRKFLKTGKAKGVRPTFDQGKDKHIYSGLKFGSNLSEVTYYLYNKSKELREVKMKPWIVKSWRAGGLKVAEDYNDHTSDVWRLEFSLKSGTKLLVNALTGEFDIFATMEIIKSEYMAKCFSILCLKYFTFVWNDGQVRKDRMRALKLFDLKRGIEVLVDTVNMKDSTRSDKIFIKKLHELNNEMRGRDFFMSVEMDKYKHTIISEKHLESWAMKKGINTDLNAVLIDVKTAELPLLHRSYTDTGVSP